MSSLGYLFIAGICVLVAFFYKDHRMYLLRSNLFDLRYQLFNLTEKEGLSFSDPLYIEMRDNINGVIRYAHKLSFTEFVLFALKSFDGNNSSKVYDKEKFKWDKLGSGINTDIMGEIKFIKFKMHMFIFHYVISVSPFGIILISLFWMFRRIFGAKMIYNSLMYEYRKSPLFRDWGMSVSFRALSY